MLSRRRFAMPFAVSGALAAVSLLGVAEPAHATGGSGTAAATTAEVALDVKLLNSVDIPVDVSLNKLTAPASRSGAALTAVVGSGVEADRPVNLLMAQVGQTDATVDAHGSHAAVNLVDAHLHLPGLPLTDLLGVRAVSAVADCPAHGMPTASAELAGEVTVLGLHVHLSVDGVTKVPVPALGEVDLKLSQHSTTSDSAAATALELDVNVNPLALNVAAVSGKIVLADVSCTKGLGSGDGGSGGATGGNGGATGGGTPSGGPSQGVTGGTGGDGGTGGVSATGGGSGGDGGNGGTSASPVAAVSNPPQGGGDGTTHLAMTGSSSATPVIGGAAIVLVAAGGGALVLTRRRRRG
ncbi:LAETG motif-containing sortase-dependent surface protein [Streptacidiphilus jiangxiensis]|uniref:LPXTG-motif cell wall anchor domain-containing protein n=1 Tax=Streptacidiphilus jiangxiensis TaxID=235985 RepID=A0A1H7L9F6_STRJI|nr:LAETG motif-containing sortase-dependent surface protein [Streptacidiphilus jiangxiensis]SEK95622.1 LPXTG-motif cell wall anchor domain-containing protein [Streptacidiphilus jiangxiensis]